MPRPLTTTEHDILRWKATGRTVHDIAQALRQTERQVQNALSRAIRATGARTLDQAIQIINRPRAAE